MNTKGCRAHEEFITAAGERHRCLFHRDRRGGYCVTCSELPAMIAFGGTLNEARACARAEIEELIAEDARIVAWISVVQPEWW
jgi:predicted RNase H-like HicB family nuclease